MKFPDFFIARPIAAIVLSLAFVIAGLLAFSRLPLSEYPAVTPPTVQVTANYPGASPQVLADTVAGPLEQALVGTPDMMYLTGQSATDGRVQLTATFRQGTDPDLARIAVQNRVDRAEPRLPEEVQRAARNGTMSRLTVDLARSFQRFPPSLVRVNKAGAFSSRLRQLRKWCRRSLSSFTLAIGSS